MFDGLTGSVDAGTNPTHDRSVWIHAGPGVWSLNPILTRAEVPDPADHRRLADASPGADLAGEIEHVLFDTDTLDDTELVDAITGVEHLSRWAAGVRARLVAEFARRRPGDEPTSVSAEKVVLGSRWAPDELGLALERTRFDTKVLIARSLQLAHVLPDTLAALQAGTIDERRASAVCESTLVLPEVKARAVEAIVLPAARGRTVRQLRDRLRRAVHRVDPDGEYRRHQVAHRERRVTIGARDEGMASIWLSAAGADAEAAFAMVTRLAEAMGSEDGRSLDQRRSDVGIQLWTGRLTLTDLDDVTTTVSAHTGPAPAGPVNTADADAADAATSSADTDTAAVSEQAVIDAVVAALAMRPQVHETVRAPLIQVVVGLDTLTGAADRPAELVGHGPVTADTARALAADGLWKRLVTDPVSGALLDHGRTTYRPPPPLADHVTARDQYCRFPTCTRRVRELDHHNRWHDGDGHTVDTNLTGYCRTHHLLKEHRDWHVLAHPDGRLTWITPTGARHTSEPHDYRPHTDPRPDLDRPGRPDQPGGSRIAGAGTDDEPDTGPTSTATDGDPPPF